VINSTSPPTQQFDELVWLYTSGESYWLRFRRGSSPLSAALAFANCSVTTELRPAVRVLAFAPGSVSTRPLEPRFAARFDAARVIPGAL
jgi:hypothetical protein